MKKRNKLHDLLNRKDRGVGHGSGISGVLSKLFQNILADIGMKDNRWNYLIGECAKKEVSHQDNRRDLASIRGNLNKEFLRPQMTWKVFCKGMMFLRVRRFKLIIIIEHEDGMKTTHETLVEASTVFEKQSPMLAPQLQMSNVANDDDE